MGLERDLFFLASTVWGEARGEPYGGQLGVAFVVMNRVRAKRADVCAVVLAPLQFSFWNGNSAARATLGDLEDSPAWLSCHRAACAAYHALVDDPTEQANHYLVATLEPKPSWYDRTRITATIGRHVFLKLP